MTDNKLVLAYIGNGKSANRYHIPFVLQRKDKFAVKTIFSPRIHHDVWVRLDGVYYTENVEDVFGDPEIDLVVVSTQLGLHYEYTKRALESGKHCLCEKPFMETKAQAQEMVDFFSPSSSYLYGHGCHTLDQVISYFGKPNGIRYDVKP